MTKFILDSGDPQEYQKIAKLAKDHGQELWGGTTNPSLIAKSASRRIAGKKLTQLEAFELQKEIIYEIVEIVPGAVSAEVYADLTTKASEMIEQGREIASWHKRVVIKLPTTLEGFKARSELRKENIITNNTLVFSQEQIIAICLHEQLVKQEGLSRRSETKAEEWPPFISPFVGRLDDIGEDGLSLVEHGMELKKQFTEPLWMLEASVRTPYHFTQGISLGSELITAPASLYQLYFSTFQGKNVEAALNKPPLVEIDKSIKSISTLDAFIEAIENNQLDITHPLTEKGILRFTADWQAILH